VRAELCDRLGVLSEASQFKESQRYKDSDLLRNSKNSSWDSHLPPYSWRRNATVPALGVGLGNDDLCPGQRKLCADDGCNNSGYSVWDERNEYKHPCDPSYKDCIHDEHSETSEASTEAPNSLEVLHRSAEAGGYVCWSGRLFRVFVNCGVGIFDCEGLEGNSLLRGFDHKEGGEDAAEGVGDLQQVSQSSVLGIE
jgi:hypothetical protein